MMRECSCLACERDRLGMQACKRWEKRDGWDQISELNLEKASLTLPLEQRLKKSSLD